VIQEQMKKIKVNTTFMSPHQAKQDSPTSLDDREMASSDENLKLPSDGDEDYYLHKRVKNFTAQSMPDDLVVTQIEETEVFDQKFENSFKKEEPRILLQKSLDMTKLKLKKSIHNNKAHI
jgi:hypothetical protein